MQSIFLLYRTNFTLQNSKRMGRI